MGLLDSIKDFYYEAEEKYYKALDRIDDAIPVYKVIDPIDSVVPSFALLLVIAAVLLVLILGTIVSIIFVPTTSTLSVTVLDSDGAAISGALVKFSVFGEELDRKNTGADGVASLENLGRDTEVLVEVSKDGYLTKVQTVTITDVPQQLAQFSLEEESSAVLSKTIRVVDSLGAAVAKNLSLSFRCSSPYAIAPAGIDLEPSDNGVARVQVPTNCETLVVSVTDDSEFDSVSSFEIFPEESDVRIQLQETPVERGSIRVVLRSGGELVSESVQVQLFRYEELLSNPEIGPVDVSYTSGSTASFDVSTGNYIVKSTASGSLGAATSPKISISSGESEEVTLELSRSIAGKIKLQVVDSQSDDPIDDAKVTLKLQSDDTVVETKTTDSDDDSVVEFNITQDTTYRAVVEAEGYQLGKRESLSKSDSVVKIEVDPCTPSTCGELRVKILDQDALPVDSATVALYDAKTGFLAGYSNKNSDANGEAEFRSVKSGNYFAFAFKESVSGRSDEVFFSSSARPIDGAHLTVTMIVPSGVIKAIIRDKDNAPIAFALVTVFDNRTDEVLGQSIGDANGEFSLESKADKKVYLKIRQKDTTPEFADYVTTAKPVLPNTVQAFNVTLEPEIIDSDIEIEFLGLFFGDGKTATVLSKGEEYTAKFRLRIPEEKDFSEAGVHIRTGNDLIMEKDPLFIKSVSAPNTSQIKATRFDESTGLSETDYEFTNTDAKWANIVWNSPSAGIFEIEAQIMVKDTASIRDQLTVFWRAWGKNGTTERHPMDDTISQELYSEAFSRIYEIGVATLCDSDFCFSARMRDIEEGLTESVVDSYNARMLSEYELKFTILNNSSFKVHDNANLRIRNEDETLLFTGFELIDAQTKTTTGTLNGYDFNRFNVGTLDQKNKIDFTTKFVTQKAQTGVINIRLVSDEQIVFEKNISINVGATKQFSLLIQPSIFPSGIETDLNVLALDSQTSLEVEGATVKLRDRHDNVLLTSITGKDGFAFLTMPAQLPGTKLSVEVEKPEYKTAEKEIQIDGKLLDILPDTLGIALNTKTKQEAEVKFSASSLARFPLKISRIELIGDTKNLIDRQATQDALDVSYTDFVIGEGKTEEFIVKAFLTEEGKSLSARQDLELDLALDVTNFGKTWSYNIPVTVAIDLEGAVDNPTCLNISRTNWETTTEGNPVKMEFLIENNCVINGQPIEIKKLQAQIDSQTNSLGIFDITIGDNKTELRRGYNKTLVSRLLPEQTVSAILTFTPFGGVNGDEVSVIHIVASNPQETSEQVLEQQVDAKITIVNLLQCVNVEPVLIEIKRQVDSSESASFNINAGTSNVSCGGPVDFELKSELEVSPKDGRIQDGATQAIEVLSGDALQGQYPVFVYTKFGSEQEEQLTATVRVRISEDGCIQLSRYEYDILDNPDDEFDGFDTGTVTNKCFDKPVPVKVNMRSFMNAMKTGSTFGLLTFGVSILGKGLGSLFGGTEEEQSKGGLGYLTEQQLIAKHGNTGVVDVGNGYWKVVNDQYPYFYEKKFSINGYQYVPAPKGPENTTANTQQNPYPIGSGTGLATLFEAGSPTGLQLGSNQGGGLFGGGGLLGGGGLFGIGGSLVDGIFGKTDPVTQGLQAFLLATVVDYYSQEQDARFVTVQRDVEVMGLEIQEPGAEQARSNVFNQFLSSRLVTKQLTKNVPEKFREFLPYFSGAASFFRIYTKGDADIEVEQELRESIKALPETGLSPQMLSSLFGDSGGSALPALALSTSSGASNLKIEKRGIIFRNKSGFTTTKDEPKYKILRVMAIRHFYKDKEYELNDFEVENERGWFSFDFGSDPIIDPTTADLEELPPVPVDELFHLEFNAVPPETVGTEDNVLLNCQDGFRVGSTGTDALPKVKFNWSWNSISENECDVDNGNGVFCDATQFSISLLKKINSISEWVKTNGPGLSCPSPLDSYANTATIPEYDVGISSAAVSKGGNNAVVTVTVKNTNPGEVQTGVNVVLRSAASGEIVSSAPACTSTVTVLSEEKVECTYNNLSNGNYIAEATITPTVDCENCLDNSSSNFLNVNFTIGQTGLEKCDPVSTARLEEFLAASGVKADEILGKIRFRANLIEDRYSSDLQEDFDLFAKNQSFFDAPDYYNNTRNGLGVYFKDSDYFGFTSRFGEPNAEGYRLPGAGIYNVLIDIVFDDESWTLFDQQGPNAKIIVSFEKADTPKPNSPFYNLPFNGIIGDNGRVNYGLNYRGENIVINNDPDALVRTIEISGSSPVAELTVDEVEDFKTINTDERGLVLRVTGGEKPSLKFAPSYATPVILKMTNEFDNAYAFYSVEVDGGAANTGPFMSRWNGVGFNCKLFDDRFASEMFFDADTHGLNEFRECARVPGEKEQTSYGFEFCEPKKFGNVYLKTAFYTPQGRTSLLKMNVAQEEAEFITPTTEGSIVPLDHTIKGRQINSIEDVFELVKSEHICVSNEESRTEFWWNPKKVFENLDEKETDLINSCILE